MISLITRMVVRSSEVERFEAFIHENLELILANYPDSFSFSLHRSHKDPYQYVSVQLFRSQAALGEIVNSPFMESARLRYTEFFAATPAVEICDVLERG